MSDTSNCVGYVWVCLDKIPTNFRSLDYCTDFTDEPSIEIQDIFLYLANFYKSSQKLEKLETIILNLNITEEPNESDVLHLERQLSDFVDNKYIKIFSSYILDSKKGPEGDYMNFETVCMVANNYASYLCNPAEIRPSGMENRDILTAMVGSCQDVGILQKMQYRPIMGYCDDRFTYLNSIIFKDLMSLVNMAALSVLKDNLTVRKCRNCGDYFIPISRSDEIYCGKILPNGKTCKTVGYDERIKHDDILREYRKIYKTQNARKQRNSHKKNIAEKFKRWVVFAKSKVLSCQKGEINIDDMISEISSDSWME